MKKNIFTLGLLSLLFIVGCSSDDDNAGNNGAENPDPVVKNYFPLSLENTWSYENKTTIDGNEQLSNEEVTVEEKNTENDTDFYQLNSTVDNPLAPSVTSVLSNGELYKNNQTLFFNGDIDLGFEAELGDFELDLSQVVVFDANANPNQLLFSDSNSFTQSFNGIDLNVTYGVTSTNGDQFESMEVNGVTYEDVISSSLSISLEVTAGQGFLTITLLEEQNIITATHFFANQVGIIKSEVDINVEFEDLSALPLPVELPELPEINTKVEQGLTDFNVNL